MTIKELLCVLIWGIFVAVMVILFYPDTTYGSEMSMSLEAIKKASADVGIKEQALYAVCRTESDLRPYVTGDDGTSHGLCQIKTATARWMGYKGNVAGLYDPETNAYYAAKYLRYCKDRYFDYQDKIAWKLAFSCYNLGQGWTGKHIWEVVRLPYTFAIIPDAHNYITKIQRYFP